MNIKNLRQSLIMWNAPYGKLSTIENTINFYHTSYKDEIPKKELAEHLQSLESWEKYAYTNRNLFEMTFFLPNGQPYAGLLLNAGNAIAEFIDEHNRVYIRYVFGGEHKEGFLFLESFEYFTYKDEQFYPSYKCETSTEYRFTPEGKLTVTKFLPSGDGTDTMTVEEAAHPVNVTNNWEPYPELGKYNSLVKLKRWDDGDLLAGIDPNQPAPQSPDLDDKNEEKSNNP